MWKSLRKGIGEGCQPSSVYTSATIGILAAIVELFLSISFNGNMQSKPVQKYRHLSGLEALNMFREKSQSSTRWCGCVGISMRG